MNLSQKMVKITPILAVFLAVFSLTATACTYNISMAHTEGQATDVIDDTQSPQNDISPTISPTLSGLPL